MKIVKLIPSDNDKYHFGEGDLTDSPIIFHSHSLYSAIINNLIKLYGDEDFVEYEKKEGDKEKKVLKDGLKNIKLSSLFPALYKLEENDDKPKDFIYFLPKPATKLGFDKETLDKAEDDTKSIKEIKRIQFISVNALKKHYKKELKKSFKFKKENDNEKEYSLILGKRFLISEEDYKELYNYGIENPEGLKLFKSFLEQKVSIDRIKHITLDDEKGQLYSVEFVKPMSYTSNNNKNNRLIVGYYFLLDFNGDGKLLNKIECAIRLIKDEGLGGERSSGAGLFRDIIIEDLHENKNTNEVLSNIYNLLFKSNIKTKMTLSTTIPKVPNDENKNSNGKKEDSEGEDEFKKIESYQLMKISGYIYSSSKPSSNNLAKKYIYAIEEGAIVNGDINGDIVDISPDDYEHEILVNGKPILIPTKYYKDGEKNGDKEPKN